MPESMYDGIKCLAMGPKYETVVANHKAGICAAYAMDWIKNELHPRKNLNESSYPSVAQIEKLAIRQRRYETISCSLKNDWVFDDHESLQALADGWDLEVGFASTYKYHADINAQPPIAFKPGARCFYISMQSQSGGGHGIAVNPAAKRFCDSNFGIGSLENTSIDAIVREVNEILILKVKKLYPDSFDVYPVTLK